MIYSQAVAQSHIALWNLENMTGISLMILNQELLNFSLMQLTGNMQMKKDGLAEKIFLN